MTGNIYSCVNKSTLTAELQADIKHINECSSLATNASLMLGPHKPKLQKAICGGSLFRALLRAIVKHSESIPATSRLLVLHIC